MLRKFCVAGALLVLVLASGCASVQMASPEQDAAAKSFAVKPDKANIYLYRNETMGGAISMPVIVDGRAIANTGPMTYLVLEVSPGPHSILSKAESDSAVIVDAVAGHNHFVWQEVKMGFMYAGNQLKVVDEATGRAGVSECRMIDLGEAGRGL